jgi:hypothetical protein
MFFSANMIVGHQKMQMRPFAIFSAVFNHENAKVIALQSGPCRLLKSLNYFCNLLLRRLVFRSKGNHGRRVRVRVIQTVNQVSKKHRITPPHDDIFGRSFPQQISHRSLPRSP